MIGAVLFWAVFLAFAIPAAVWWARVLDGLRAPKVRGRRDSWSCLGCIVKRPGEYPMQNRYGAQANGSCPRCGSAALIFKVEKKAA